LYAIRGVEANKEMRELADCGGKIEWKTMTRREMVGLGGFEPPT
jgi:hypothetical protein